MTKITELPIKPSFTAALPADKSAENKPRQVANSGYSFVNPTPPKAPKLIMWSKSLVADLGITEIGENFLAVVSGQKNIPNMKPYAMRYGGHQFGHWAGQLGDGRAINIAETEVNAKKYVLQLKGAGLTPYSRTADGLAVLRSSIREYLMSEAMFHLGVPTTRALSLALSGANVLRDVMYDGNPAYEKGAIVCRVAPSFVRFGNFEILAANGEHDLLKKLADHVIQTHYDADITLDKQGYLSFFEKVCERSLAMVIDWQCVGFVHGVMNTDNMSILGLTIDYGPYGWLENFDPSWTPNTTDRQHKRYRFGNQPNVVLWNLTQLANALYPLIEDAPALQAILEDFKTNFQADHQKMMLSKIGIFDKSKDDALFLQQLEGLLYSSQIDYVRFFRRLANFNLADVDATLTEISADSYLTEDEFMKKAYDWKNWLTHYNARLQWQEMGVDERRIKMNAINPKYVLRNYMAHLAIEAADKGNYTVLHELEELLQNPYAEQPEMEKWFAKRPDWATEKVGCSMLSCSS